jgi:Gpi18-like mannosyltransferase/4-amino-4-deoxy-L-arabinose transferase-like glycosyltransferase
MATQKRRVFALALAGLCLFMGGLSAESENLIKNGNFAQVGADSLPLSWKTGEWTPGDTVFETRSDPARGNYFHIESKDQDDAKLLQTVKVKPNTAYKLSCWVRATKIPTGNKGANISVTAITDTSASLYETNGGWYQIYLYGKTRKGQHAMEVSLRLGGYSSLNSGAADFSDVRVEALEAAPPGVTVVPLDVNPIAKTSINGAQQDPLVLFLSILFFLALVFFFDDSALVRNSLGGSPGKKASARGIIALAFLALIGLGLRAYFCLGDYGYRNDVNTFKSWASQLFGSNLVNFYKDAKFADYPPGYMYILYLLGALRSLFSLNLGSAAFSFLIKLPATLCDVALAFVLYRIVSERSGKARGLLAAAVFFLCPFAINNSAVWGQVDSIFALAMCLSLFLLDRDKLVWGGFVFGLAILIKPQALMFTPVYFYVFISRRDIKRAALSVLAGVGALALGCLPFMLASGWKFPIDLYTKTLSSYPYASLNAANMWGMLGANFAPVSSPAFLLTYAKWGTVALVVIVALSAAFYFLSARAERKSALASAEARPGTAKAEYRLPIFETAALIALWVFTFSVKIHERYLYIFVPLALAAWAGRRSHKTLIFAYLVSLVHYLNVSEVYLLSRQGKFIPNNDQLYFVCSLLIFAAALLAPLAFKAERPYNREEDADWLGKRLRAFLTRRDSEIKEAELLYSAADKKARRLREGLSLLACVVFASVVGFTYIGDAKAPEKAWGEGQTQATLDLGEVREVASFSYFSGIGGGEFNLSFSKDGTTWSAPVSLKSFLYVWKNQLVGQSARYARINVTHSGLRLIEVAFWAKGEIQRFPVSAVEESSRALVDEQSAAAPRATALNSMYFDEIYHARTAFEHLHAMEPYEWTHPPLGKLIIAVGIHFLGMNPFAWRLLGVLFGILAIPLFFFLARKVFPAERSILATAATMLFSLDFMRYTQTRLGTVDVYVLFFVIASFLFMYDYYLTVIEGRKRDYLSLGLCGLFFGLGAATKWNSIYGGLGLAVIFFVAFVRGIKADRAAGKRGLALRSLGVIGFCVAVFIVLPLAIYVASYIPTLYVKGHDWQSIISYQSRMYNYHSKLVATHAFASPWWQWPWMVRPVWYFKADGLPQGWTSTIVAMGNPLIWWPSLVAALMALGIAIYKKDDRFLPVLAAYFSQYLPWTLVPRLTFLYHYFPLMPFFLLCDLYVLRALLPVKARSQGGRLETFVTRDTGWAWLYVGLCLLLFIFFFPALSGLPVPTAWVHAERWFYSWVF